jgi:threonine dehydrogenase-like Zn-dependent dehydrogenase
MRALVFDGPGSISYRADLANPQLLDDRDAIVVLDGAGLCGSDLHPYLGREPARAGVIPGHEAVGSVVATGSGVVHIRPGDRVIIPFTASCGVCRPCMSGLSSRCDQAVLFGWGHPDRTEVAALQGMQAQSVRVPMADSTLVRIPDSVTIPQAILLADNLPTGWHAVRRSDVSRGETLSSWGQDPSACAQSQQRCSREWSGWSPSTRWNHVERPPPGSGRGPSPPTTRASITWIGRVR